MMKRTPTFHSSLAQTMTDFVTYKRIEGFDYSAQAVCLRYFDRFLSQQRHNQTTLNRQIVDAYVVDTAKQAPNTRYNRLSIVRVFSRYLHQFAAGSYVLHEQPTKRPSLPRWYLYSSHDIAMLLRNAKMLGPAGSLRSHCFYMLIGLLYVTGLRIAEALALNINDIDTSCGSLFVRRGKFGKERYVVLAPSTLQAVEKYLRQRTAYEPSGVNTPFFLTTATTTSGTRLKYSTAAQTFRQMVRQCGIDRDVQQPPRLHDLRHTAACNCLLKWYDEGEDVNTKLPILATAMGHVNIECTQVYIHITSRLLEQAAQRFHVRFTDNSKGE